MLLFCEKHILKTKSSRFVIWASGRFWTTFECPDRFPMQQRRFVSMKRDATVTSETVRWSESGPRWCSIPHCWESCSLKLLFKINNVSTLRYGLGKLLRRCLGPPSFGGDSAFESSKKYEGPLRYLTTVPFRGGAKKSFTGGSSIFKLTILQYCGGALPVFCSKQGYLVVFVKKLPEARRFFL